MRKFMISVAALCLVLASAAAVQADVKVKQKSQVKFEGVLGRMMNLFGGKAAKEGIVSTVAVKGNRQMTVNDNTGELVDLDEERVYNIDFKGKSYKVQTFAEIRKQFEDAKAEARKEAAKQQDDPKAADEPQFEVDVDIKPSGAQKAISGQSCDEVVTTITLRQKGKTLEQAGGMVLTAHSWMGPRNAAMHEQVTFQQRYMKKLLGSDSETFARDLLSAMAMYPGMQDGMARMKKEAAKMDGTAYLTVVTFESVATEEQARARADSEKQGGGGIGGIAGGLGGMFGRKKKDEAPKEGGAPAGSKTRSTIMTTTTEVLGVETAVNPVDLEIPAGFKQK